MQSLYTISILFVISGEPHPTSSSPEVKERKVTKIQEDRGEGIWTRKNKCVPQFFRNHQGSYQKV